MARARRGVGCGLCFPGPQGYVMNLTAIADGEPAIPDFTNYVNFTAMAEGLVGAVCVCWRAAARFAEQCSIRGCPRCSFPHARIGTRPQATRVC